MAQKSFYDALEVDQSATLEEIKLAFKRRALQVHPDKGGSKEAFHLVYEALETLATFRSLTTHWLQIRLSSAASGSSGHRRDLAAELQCNMYHPPDLQAFRLRPGCHRLSEQVCGPKDPAMLNVHWPSGERSATIPVQSIYSIETLRDVKSLKDFGKDGYTTTPFWIFSSGLSWRSRESKKDCPSLLMTVGAE